MFQRRHYAASAWSVPRRGYGCLLLFALGLASGCGAGSTREPIYDPAKEGIFDTRLIGTWSWTGAWGFPEGTIEFIRGPDKSYLVRITDLTLPENNETESGNRSAKAGGLPMDLIRLGKYGYLFVRSNEPETGTLLFPSYRVEFTYRGRELCLRLLNTFASERFLETHPDVLRFEETPLSRSLHSTTRMANETRPAETWPRSKDLILTDSPAKIRRFLIRHQDDRNWVFEPWVLHRLEGEVSY